MNNPIKDKCFFIKNSTKTDNPLGYIPLRQLGYKDLIVVDGIILKNRFGKSQVPFKSIEGIKAISILLEFYNE